MTNTKSRKWQLTINNPDENGFTHESIKEKLILLSSVIYYCMADEKGLEEKTPHTHVFLAASSPVRFSTIKKHFPEAHIEMVRGTCQENRDYIFKEGKWLEDTKNETNNPDSHEEWGEMPVERQGARNDYAILYDMIKSGMSNYEIMETTPQYMFRLADVERVRQTLREEKIKNEYRILDVTYIYGVTGSGKTRSVMEKHGYENVFRVTSYTHGGFDAYKGQDILILDEFSSSLKIQDMLNYLDGYPVEFPCRYINKVACYTIVYIISNIPLEVQYPNVRQEAPTVWEAFLRRINRVLHYTGQNEFEEYTIEEYFSQPSPQEWQEIPNTGDLPF